MSIEAVILDADGVVIFPWLAAQRFEQEYDITRQMTAAFFGGIFGDCLVGKAELVCIFSIIWGAGGVRVAAPPSHPPSSPLY